MASGDSPDTTESEAVESVDKSTQAEEGQGAASILPPIELHIPQSIIERCESHKEKRDRSDKCKFRIGLIVNILTLIAVAAYATVACYQWGEMRRANNIAQDALVASSRPWVGFAPVNPIQDLEVGKMPIITIAYQNFGKAPAFNVTSWSGIVLAPSTMPTTQIREEIDNHHTKVNLDMGTLWPSNGTVSTNTATLPTNLTEEQLAGINSGKQQLQVIGQIVYWDTFSKHPHHTWIDVVYRPDAKGLGVAHPQDAPPDD